MSGVRSRIAQAHFSTQQFRVRFAAWCAFLRNRGAYRVLSEVELKATRKRDTVFIFGSGGSLNEITPDEWQQIAEGDTLGFNWFVHQRFVRCDYHLVREICSTDLDRTTWQPEIRQYFELIAANPLYAHTVFLVQTGFRATNGNRAIGLRLLPPAARVFLWRSRRDLAEPTRSLAEGLTHAHSTLQECVNFAYLMGWRRIVLVGVDLYDRQYFWMPPGAPLWSDATTAEVHRTAAGLIESLGRWRRQFEREGVELFVYNPRSLLAAVLPVWSRSSHAAAS
jgi:hypothetical protein